MFSYKQKKHRSKSQKDIVTDMANADCSLLVNGILTPWGYPLDNIPAQAAVSCCTWTTVVSCIIDATGTPRISSLNLAGVGLNGNVPIGIGQLTSLQTLDISNNPSASGGLEALTALTSLTTLIASNDGFQGQVPTFPKTLLDCRFDGTKLCGDPGAQCQVKVPALPACPSNNNNNNDQAASFNLPTASLALYIILAVVGLSIILAAIMCIACNRRGKVAQRILEARGGVGSSSSSKKSLSLTRQGKRNSRAPSGEEGVYPSSAKEEPSEAEMAAITLSRNGPPNRTYSLPENRAKLTADENQLDVQARDPFLKANYPSGSDEFPVRRPFEKNNGDELTLTEGDRVVLLRVFRDGWAEGVSMRAGGPALFPLACLGGGVPVVLAERLRIAREIMARSGSYRPPPPPVGAVSVPGANYVGKVYPGPPPPMGTYPPGPPPNGYGYGYGMMPMGSQQPGPNPEMNGVLPPPPMGYNYNPGLPVPPPGMLPMNMPPPPTGPPPPGVQQQNPYLVNNGGYGSYASPPAQGIVAPFSSP
ncbi:hypothetical protein HDU76_004026, partial [Blyttiomyces sp. JEL0837]